MSDNLHHATLQPYIEAHESDLADLRRRADAVRDRMRRRPEREPKPPPDRATVRRELAALERSIDTHERIIGLARDDRVAELLQTVADDPEQAREAAADPRSFAARHGLDLPESLEIDMLVGHRLVSARIRHLADDMPFELTWTQDGFPPPPEPPDVRRGESSDGSA